MPGPAKDECALQNEGQPCACGRLRPGCPHLIRARSRRLMVTLVEDLGARRVLEIGVSIRAIPGVAWVQAR